jgi:hypothetical protein
MSFLKRLFGGSNTQSPPSSSRAAVGDAAAGKAERLQPKDTSAPTGSKAELFRMIEEMSLTKTDETELAKAIAATNRFGIDVVKELTLDSFFSKWPIGDEVRKVGGNTVRFVSMQVGAAMGGPSFARWLGENIVAGRQPAQMIDDPYKYGSWGMWQDAKALCEKLGVRFTGPA